MNAQQRPDAPDATPEAAVDATHPWLGLDFFTEATRQYFYGREEEVAELARRVRRKPLTILFGQSGLGKTSILRAGIVPRLRPDGYCPVYVRLDYSREAPSPAEQIKQAILRETRASGTWTQTGIAEAGETLWEFLHHRDDTLHDESGRPLTPLLIFDQFEEIFTLAQNDDFGRQRTAEFIDDLSDLVENRAPTAVEARIEREEASSEKFDFARCDYRILISLREDYLAHLEGLKGVMPSITQNRMRLAPMNGTQALAAVLKPGGALVSEEVAGAIVRFVAGGAEIANAEVEPALLSLICRELNNARIAQARAEISTDVLAGSHASILSEFYTRALADQPAGVHRIIEDELLTESGFRENVAEERVLRDFAEAGAQPKALATLVNRRLLRIEERLDVRRVELTHDVLCSVVMAARAARQEREAREQAERELAGQRAREEATRRALARARLVAGVCALLAIGAIVGAIFGFAGMQRARSAEAQAVQARAMTETARSQAEKLVVYLLDDFYLELEPVGRLDVIGQLAQRTLGYYDALPQALRSTDSERNRALALGRYAAVLRNQSSPAKALSAVRQALEVLERLYQQGDRSEATLVGLGLSLTTLARIDADEERRSAAIAESGRAVTVLKPAATAPNASVAIRRAYANSLTYVGFLDLRDAHEERGAAETAEAREVFRRIANLDLSDPAAIAGYAEAATWEVESLDGIGRQADARRVGEDAVAVANRLLEERPGYATALRAVANISGSLGRIAATPGRLTEALALSDQAIRGWDTLVRLDPSNVIAWNNLAASRFSKSDVLSALGRPRDALGEYFRIQNVHAGAPKSTMLENGRRFGVWGIYELQAELGMNAELESSWSRVKQAFDTFAADVPAGGYEAKLNAVFLDAVQQRIQIVRGEYAAVLRRVPGLYAEAASWKPSSDFDRRRQNTALANTRERELDAAYAIGDYARAAAAGEDSVAKFLLTEPRVDDDLRSLDDRRAKWALALARVGRGANAAVLAAEVLKRDRERAARSPQDQGLRAELARALLAMAAANPASGTSELREAAQLMAGLSPEMRGLASNARWRARIDEELARRS